MACTRRWRYAVRSRPPDDRLSHGGDRDAALDERPRAAARAHDRRKAPLVPGASGPSPHGPLPRASRAPRPPDRGDDRAGHARRPLRALLHLSRRLLRFVRRELAKRFAQRGVAVREAVNAQLQVDVPGLGKTSVEMVLVHELPDADGVSPNALVWGPGQVDAAPCGSGTCARMALFHHRGLMKIGSTFVSRGLLGLDFTGRIAGETEIEGRRAIPPEITGTAYLTGLSQFLFDPEDPVRAGYLLDA